MTRRPPFMHRATFMHHAIVVSGIFLLAGVAVAWPAVSPAASCSEADRRQMRSEGLSSRSIERICTSNDDDDNRSSAPASRRNTTAQSAPRTSNRCFTPVTACYLPGSGPIGAACWCATPFGPANGSVQ